MNIDLEPIWFRWTRREHALSDERDPGSAPARIVENEGQEIDPAAKQADRPVRRARQAPRGLGEAWYRKGARR